MGCGVGAGVGSGAVLGEQGNGGRMPQPGRVGHSGTGQDGCAWDGMGVPGRGTGMGQLQFGHRGSSLEGGRGSLLTDAAWTGFPAVSQALTDLGQAGIRAQGLLPCPTIPPHCPYSSSIPMCGLAHRTAALCFLQKKEKSSLCLLLSSFLNIYIRGACGEQK